MATKRAPGDAETKGGAGDGAVEKLKLRRGFNAAKLNRRLLNPNCRLQKLDLSETRFSGKPFLEFCRVLAQTSAPAGACELDVQSDWA